MCDACEEAAEPLREVYLARRARMAATWRPKGPGRWYVDPPAPVAADVQGGAAPNLIAAE
jgi:hypothetical protein